MNYWRFPYRLVYWSIVWWFIQLSVITRTHLDWKSPHRKFSYRNYISILLIVTFLLPDYSEKLGQDFSKLVQFFRASVRVGLVSKSDDPLCYFAPLFLSHLYITLCLFCFPLIGLDDGSFDHFIFWFMYLSICLLNGWLIEFNLLLSSGTPLTLTLYVVALQLCSNIKKFLFRHRCNCLSSTSEVSRLTTHSGAIQISL